MTPTYSNITDVYERYCVPRKFICFEGEIYKLINTEIKADVATHLYRCETEQHNLKIHLQGGKPFYVEGVYKVEDGTNAIRRAV